MPIGKYSKEQGEELIALARSSINSIFTNEKVSIPQKTEYKQARGIFVTLTKVGELRGCIGFPNAVYPIGEAVVKMARAAAFEDPRFPELKKEELDKIKIEISVLTEPYEIKGDVAKNFELGKEGLICEFMGYSGLLLPQVVIEHKMNKIEFLECVCQKAGLPKNSWQNPNVKFEKFRVQSFKEK